MRVSVLAVLAAGAWLTAPAAAQSMPRDQQARDFMSRFIVNGEAQVEGYGAAPHAVVTLSCGGSARADSNGKFVVSGVVGTGGNQYCEVVISVPGCETRSVPLAAPAGTVAVGIVKMQPLIGMSGAGMVSFWSLQAPAESAKLREQARKDAARKKFREAEAGLKKALQKYDRDPESWFELGMVQRQSGDEPGARASFEKAAEADANYAPPRMQLAALALQHRNWVEVVSFSRRVTGINPADFPQAWLYLAIGLLNQGDAKAAESAARKAAEGKSGLAKAHHILGAALASQNRYAEAIEELRTYLREAPQATDAAMIREHLKLLEREAAKQ